MGWERRGKKGAHFFYLARRTPDGRVAKEYFGRGERAHAAAAAIASAQAQRQADRQALLEEAARLAAVDSQTGELVEVAHLLFEAALLANGFHRLNFGKWRKQRGEQGRTRTATRTGGPVRN
jgi:hypothetical protein